MAEFIVSGVFWYGFVGWCTANLHLYMGFYSRYQGAKRWVSWSVIFLLWPITLPLFVEYIGQLVAGDDSHD